MRKVSFTSARWVLCYGCTSGAFISRRHASTSSTEERLRRVHDAMGGSVAEEIARRVDKGKFFDALDRKTDAQWMDRKFHYKAQDKAIAKEGLESAVRESLAPSRPSYTQELKGRTLDKRILAEIHREQHGDQAGRKLQKGWKYEQFIAKDDRNLPVNSASIRAKETFGAGAKVTLEARAQDASQFPVSSLPEIAFLGRTNAGKSALINAVVNNTVAPFGTLAGTTTAINFYRCGNAMMLVDLPGYGFYSPSQTPQLEAKNAVSVMRQYLGRVGRHELGMRNVRRVLLCVSWRGLDPKDVEYAEMLEAAGCHFGVVICKTDKAKAKDLAKRVDLMRAQLAHYSKCEELLMTSALRLSGITPLQNRLASMARPVAKTFDAAAEDIASIV